MKVKQWINGKKRKKDRETENIGFMKYGIMGVHTRRFKTNGAFTCRIRFSGPSYRERNATCSNLTGVGPDFYCT